ncbi:MAG TPA: hypothetical protein VL860_09825, partial [Planctomycetota bacterium]|nr:hypothetical protein [Planctomycetota bacterium]
EAGTATALDLIDLHDDFVKLCGDDPKQRFDRLMRANLSTYKKPLGILPERTPFRDQLAVAVGPTHSYLDGVIANPDVDREPFAAVRQRADAVDAYLKTQRSDDALPRWNRLFATVAKPPAAWPYQTAAWREKNDRLMAAAWVGTPVRSLLGPAVNPKTRIQLYSALEAAPDFYHRLAALTRERASTLAKADPVQTRLTALAEWLEQLSRLSLDQLAGRPVEPFILGGGIPDAADAGHTESTCRVALKVASPEAGTNDLLMGNGPLAHILILQRDKTGVARIYVGAVSNPREGLAPHGNDPRAAWERLAADGVLNGFHYNGR